MMLAPTLLAATVALAANPAPAPRLGRAQVTAFVRIIRAAEIRGGETDVPHRRQVRLDETGARRILIEFE